MAQKKYRKSKSRRNYRKKKTIQRNKTIRKNMRGGVNFRTLLSLKKRQVPVETNNNELHAVSPENTVETGASGAQDSKVASLEPPPPPTGRKHRLLEKISSTYRDGVDGTRIVKKKCSDDLLAVHQNLQSYKAQLSKKVADNLVCETKKSDAIRDAETLRNKLVRRNIAIDRFDNHMKTVKEKARAKLAKAERALEGPHEAKVQVGPVHTAKPEVGADGYRVGPPDNDPNVDETTGKPQWPVTNAIASKLSSLVSRRGRNGRTGGGKKRKTMRRKKTYNKKTLNYKRKSKSRNRKKK